MPSRGCARPMLLKMPRVGAGLDPAIDALRTTVDDPGLRRLTAAWVAVIAGKWAFLVTTLVIVYQAGGAVAVGLLGLARFLTPTLIAPFAGLPTVRWRPEAVLRAVNTIRTGTIALGAAAVALGLPMQILFALVALEAGVGAFTRPLHMALLPALARTPRQLVAANVTSSAAEGLGTFVGPALAGVLLALAGPVGAILAVVAIYAIGVASIARLHVPAVGRSETTARAALGQLSARCQGSRRAAWTTPHRARPRAADVRAWSAHRPGRRRSDRHARDGRARRRRP